MAKRFYYDTGTEKIGPVTGTELVRLRDAGQLANDTWVRREGSSTWRPLHSVNLREEEEEEANPGLLKILIRSGLLGPVLLGILALVVFILLAAGVVAALWPILLVLFFIWLLYQAIK